MENPRNEGRTVMKKLSHKNTSHNVPECKNGSEIEQASKTNAKLIKYFFFTKKKATTPL